MSLYENIYNILSKINEAELNTKASESEKEFFNKKDLVTYIDGLMDKHNNNIEKVIDELNNYLDCLKTVDDGWTIKEDSEYRYGGMEASNIHENDLKVWEVLLKNKINPRIVSQGLKLLDSNMARGFRLSRHGNYNKGNPIFYGNYFVTIKDKDTNKIHNVYEKKSPISLAKLKELVYDPINTETILNAVDYIGDEEAFSDFYNIQNIIKRHKENVKNWMDNNKNTLDTFTPEIKYMCYILSQKEDYPLDILKKFFDSDRATPENIKYLNTYYHINQSNNPLLKTESVVHLYEAERAFPETVYKNAGKGEEGVIANEALKQLGFPFLIATTLSLPYDQLPEQPVKKLSPFQKPKEIKHKNVRIVAVPKTVVDQLLDVKSNEDGISFDVPENPVKIDENNNVLYVQGDDDLKPFPVTIAEIREILDNNGKRFKQGELTSDEQEELLTHRNITQKGIGGKQISFTDDQIIQILNNVFDMKPYNIIFENPSQIIDLYRDSLTTKNGVELIKRMLNSYIYPKIVNQYPGIFNEKHKQNLIKAYPNKKSGISYRVVVPLNADGIMSQKIDKFNIFDEV